MQSARDLLYAYVEALNNHDPAAAAALYADDGTLDFPFAASVGRPSAVTGPAALEAFLTDLLDFVPDFAFHDVELFLDTPDHVFAEYRVDATTKIGRPFANLYGARLTARNGKITLLREYLDVVLTARAMLPNGTRDIPA